MRRRSLARIVAPRLFENTCALRPREADAGAPEEAIAALAKRAPSAKGVTAKTASAIIIHATSAGMSPAAARTGNDQSAFQSSAAAAPCDCIALIITARAPPGAVA